MKTILVPVDFSPATTRVCEAACTLAKLIHARLLLLHAVQTPSALMNDYYGFGIGQMAEVTAAMSKNSLRRLRALSEKYSERGLKVTTLQETGAPVRSF
jgi:nucleotide-binding universal stress UspA family protein